MYNYIYLCIKPKDSSKIISNFSCYRFDSYENANIFFYHHFINNENRPIISTMIPVCKYIPVMFHPYIIHYKLSKSIIKTIIEKND